VSSLAGLIILRKCKDTQIVWLHAGLPPRISYLLMNRSSKRLHVILERAFAEILCASIAQSARLYVWRSRSMYMLLSSISQLL